MGKIIECKQPLNLKYRRMKIATVKNSLEEKMKFYDFTKLAN
jgi:hypothetical protein